MSDIAREAGIARPTLYKHFKGKTEVLFMAIDMVAYAFAESVVKHARDFDTIEDRVIETIVYVVEELPKDKNLSLVLNMMISKKVIRKYQNLKDNGIFNNRIK